MEMEKDKKIENKHILRIWISRKKNKQDQLVMKFLENIYNRGKVKCGILLRKWDWARLLNLSYLIPNLQVASRSLKLSLNKIPKRKEYQLNSNSPRKAIQRAPPNMIYLHNNCHHNNQNNSHHHHLLLHLHLSRH